MKTTELFKYKESKDTAELWSKDLLITHESLEDAFRQIGYYINGFKPFDNINILVSVGNDMYQVYLDWMTDHTIEVRYTQCKRSSSLNPIVDRNFPSTSGKWLRYRFTGSSKWSEKIYVEEKGLTTPSHVTFKAARAANNNQENEEFYFIIETNFYSHFLLVNACRSSSDDDIRIISYRTLDDTDIDTDADDPETWWPDNTALQDETVEPVLDEMDYAQCRVMGEEWDTTKYEISKKRHNPQYLAKSFAHNRQFKDLTHIEIAGTDKRVYKATIRPVADNNLIENFVELHCGSVAWSEVLNSFYYGDEKPVTIDESSEIDCSPVIWTWDVLNTLTMEELEEIRTDKKDELCKIQQEKNVIIANILSLQEMIKDEKTMGDMAKLQQEIDEDAKRDI